MALAPGASQRAKLDRTRSYFERETEYPLVTGVNFTEEGEIAMAVNTGTVVHASPSLGAAVTEVPLGVILNGTIDAVTFAHWETGTVPAGLTYTTKFNNISADPYNAGPPQLADAFVYNIVTGAEIPVVAPAPGAGSCSIVLATGVITFNADQLNVRFGIRYRWDMTVAQSLALCRMSPYGRSSEALYGKINIGRGHGCRVFTTQYNANSVWTLGLQTYPTGPFDASPCLGVNGLWSTCADNNNGTPFGRCISLPGANDPYVGFEYNTP